MPILYAMVARESLVLAEFSLVAGNASSVARRILEKLSMEGEKRVSYTKDNHVFHILQNEGLTFLCMADAQFGRRIPFAFLDDISVRFLSAYKNRLESAIAFSMNDEFCRVLAQQIEFFSNNPNSDTISRVRSELKEVRSVMVENIDKVLDRGERIELLVDKTSGLSESSFRFKKQSRTLQRALWWENAKLIVILSFVAIFAIYLLLALICGGPLFNSCLK